jgi:hypothetical protein
MKLFLFLFLTGVCFAEDYIGLRDKVTNAVKDIVNDTPANRATWDRIKGGREVIVIADSAILNQTKPLILKDGIVQVDTAKETEEINNVNLDKKIELQKSIDTIDKMLLTAKPDEVVILNKKKAELQAECNATSITGVKP